MDKILNVGMEEAISKKKTEKPKVQFKLEENHYHVFQLEFWINR